MARLPLLHPAKIVEQRIGHYFLGERPKLTAWQKALLATGLAENSVTPDFEEAFAAYYLSDETCLGRGGKVVPSVVTSCGARQAFC